MTKKEIYEGVVRFTKELEARGISREFLDTLQYAKLFNDYSVIDSNLKMIPYKYADLYTQIVQFGKDFNEMIGDTDEDWLKFYELQSQGELLFNISGTGIIREIFKAFDNRDSEKIIKLIEDFHKEHFHLAQETRKYQHDIDDLESRMEKCHDGEIFGPDPDEENGIYVFDINVIDPFSFFLFSILALIDIRYLFQCDEYEEGSVYSLRSLTNFIEGIRDVTNNSFAEFVGEYCPLDWVGQAEGDYSTIGELFYDAICDKFTEHRSKLHVISSYLYRD